MNQNHHRECFGTTFPDVLHLQNHRLQRGKAFLFPWEWTGDLFRSTRNVSAAMSSGRNAGNVRGVMDATSSVWRSWCWLRPSLRNNSKGVS